FACLVMGWPGAILGAIIGWFVQGWIGVVLGIIVGSVTWVAVGLTRHYVAFRRRFLRQRQNASNMSTDQLLRIAADPTSPDLGFAIGELDRRGIEALPSLESLFALVTSENSNRRGLGLSLLGACYPDLSAKLPPGSSSMDAPEVWCTRVVALKEQ